VGGSDRGREGGEGEREGEKCAVYMPKFNRKKIIQKITHSTHATKPCHPCPIFRGKRI
jgi:hypothetical protein